MSENSQRGSSLCILPPRYEEAYSTRKKWRGSKLSYGQWDFNTFSATDEVAFCLIILSEPQLKQEPTASLSMCLAGAGLLPSSYMSTGKLPGLTTFSKTCFHCCKSLTYEENGNANNFPSSQITKATILGQATAIQME